MLFFVRNTVKFPHDLPAERKAELLQAEREVSQRAQRDGVMRHLWRITGQFANCGIYEVASNDELHDFLAGLPMFDYLEIEVTPLSTHPNSLEDVTRLQGQSTPA